MPDPLTLAEARQGFQTSLTTLAPEGGAPELPPEDTLRLVRYRTPAGGLPAYVSHLPARGEPLQPAIIWLAGEFSRTIGSQSWNPGAPDCTSTALREAGLFIMLPSLRGGHDFTGVSEAFLGEVVDVLCAARELSRRRGIDPRRIYLGGHSTGGTLALLAAECSDLFRAVFCFGPVEDVHHYSADHLPFDHRDPREWELRSPGRWLHGILRPTFIFEGSRRSNKGDFRHLAAADHPACLSLYVLPGADHFSGVAPMLGLIAGKILADTGAEASIHFTPEEIAAAVAPA